jgi:hypothetical protein
MWPMMVGGNDGPENESNCVFRYKKGKKRNAERVCDSLYLIGESTPFGPFPPGVTSTAGGQSSVCTWYISW